MAIGPAYTYTARALRVVDGDTCLLEIQLGLRVATTQMIRLAHVNTPELKDAGGAAARDRFRELLAVEPLTVTTTRDRTEKFGRYLAVVVNADGVDVGAQLLAEGMAVPYESGRR